jgi:mediator of RNA polymerase II transcription subunit 7
MSSIGSSPEQQPIHDSEAAAPQQQGSAEELDTSFFPNPPIYFSRYTTANLALLPTEPLVDDEKLLAQELLPPREDWIREGGSYTVFGETWPVIEVVPTLEEMGVTEMFDRHTGKIIPFI